MTDSVEDQGIQMGIDTPTGSAPEGNLAGVVPGGRVGKAVADVESRAAGEAWRGSGRGSGDRI